VRYRITGPLGLLGVVTALMSVGPTAYAQNICTGSNPGVGDQVWGTTFGPTELASACGVTAVGYFSLVNDTGNLNTAVGNNALFANTSGAFNSAFGGNALYSNTTGSSNMASGLAALASNTSGSSNTASGYAALSSTTIGSYNTADGFEALSANTTANYNTAIGSSALYKNTTGANNAADGYQALYNTTTGSNNVGLGYEAGYNQTTGSNNIYIDNLGVAAESAVIRIGVASTQTATYVAGITGVAVTGAAVYVTTSGQLGVLSSSERYKTAIAPMGSSTEKLTELRPVSFHLKNDPKGAVQYGLIAEEVDKVYPELVIRDDAGKIQGVRYEELAPMLLNELQDQQRKVTAVAKSNVEQAATITAQADEIRELKRQQAEMQTALRALQTSVTTSRGASGGDIANRTVAEMRPAAFLQASGR
jgi:hypothetical protein